MNIHSDDMKQATRIVTRALAAGLTVSVWDGEAWAIKRSADKAAILACMGAAESDTLRLRDSEGNVVGSVFVIYGNGPGCLVADHTDNPVIRRVVG